MTIRLSAAALAVLSAVSAFAVAAETQGEALIVTATRQPSRAQDLLASVDTLDREQIERAGQSSLLELLARQPGIQMSDNGGPGKTSGLYMRGTNANHTILFIDGVRVGSVTAGQAALESLPLSHIERIEILRGPASALYGADAVGGVIQIFTKRGEGPLQLEAFAGAGSKATRDVLGGISGATGPWSYALRLSQYETEGVSARKGPYPTRKFWHDYDPALDADKDGFRATSLGGNLGYSFNKDHSLALNFLRIDARNWYDGGGFNSVGGADVGNDAVVESLALESRNRLAAGWLSTLRVARSKDESEGFRNTNHFNSEQNQVLWQHDVDLPLGRAMLAYEYLDQKVDSSTTYTVQARHINAWMAGWSGSLGNHLFQANLRQDENSQFGDKLTYLLSYGYRITPALRAGVSLGTSFKAPTLNDLYYVDSGGNHGDPNLKPEEGRNREISLRYEVAGTRLSAVYFDNRVDNLIQWGALAPDYVYVPLQTDNARLKGWELGYAGALGEYELSASIDLLNARNEDTGKDLIRRARQAARFGISRQVGALSLGGEWQLAGKRYADVANTDPLPGYGLVNLFGHYQLNRDWRIEARANNVFDRDYELARGYNTWGASVFVGLRYLPR
ncbi:MAG: TonB-dependent receptor [Rhodocyclaceae bacterium]|jgi:vitamin B12 transporter|nr:TonB-dependent receptor [Rhodocyclaceae bacterium]MDY0014194.1 TonB-dependent receptor [Rhodocyclaceae bacterium]